LCLLFGCLIVRFDGPWLALSIVGGISPYGGGTSQAHTHRHTRTAHRSTHIHRTDWHRLAPSSQANAENPFSPPSPPLLALLVCLCSCFCFCLYFCLCMCLCLCLRLCCLMLAYANLCDVYVCCGVLCVCACVYVLVTCHLRKERYLQLWREPTMAHQTEQSNNQTTNTKPNPNHTQTTKATLSSN
jgi:hypothetical protein